MAQKFLTNVELEAGLVDGSNSTGTSGYLLSSTGTATSWVDPAAVSVGESEQVHIACKNTSGVAISKGDPVYITGTVGTSFKIQIAAADASNSSKMPAVGLAETDLAHNAEGFVIVSGVLKNLTTDPLSTSDGTPSSNDTVYVKAGGGLTRTRPTGSGNLIQNVGKVGRVNSANAGSLAVSTIMRTNDVPNLTTGKIWVGSPTYTTESTVVHLDETNGRMGIGTTSPSQKLEVIGTIKQKTGAGYTNYVQQSVLEAQLTFSTYSNNQSSFPSAIKFSPNGSEAMRIDNDGNVGIGTASPQSKLQLNGGDGLTVTANDAAYVANYFGRMQSDYGTNALRLVSRAGDVFRATNYGQDVAILTGTSGAGTSERMRIDSSGNVSIGTTSPSTVGGIAKMTVNVGSGAASPISIVNGTTDGMYIRRYSTGGSYQLQTTLGNANSGNLSLQSYGGNVGIGTTSPSQKAVISGPNTNPALNTTAVSSATLLLSNSDTAYGTYFCSLGTGTGLIQQRRQTSAVYYDLAINPYGGNVGIGTSGPSEKLEVSGNVKMAETSATTDTDKFVVLDSGVLKYRTGAEVLADIGAQPSIVAPNAPTNLTTTIVNSTINVTFTASTTSGIDYYLVFSSVDGGDYGLISVIPPADFGATMSIIDDSFDATGTQAYRVYAVKNGVYSSPLTGNKSFSVTTPLEPTNMSVVNLNTAYYVQWDPPSANTRFVTAYNVYKHESATQASLSRSSATLVYSGMNTSYMYQISGNNNNNFHQFWVETTIA